jgi:hypothetical protein
VWFIYLFCGFYILTFVWETSPFQNLTDVNEQSICVSFDLNLLLKYLIDFSIRLILCLERVPSHFLLPNEIKQNKIKRNKVNKNENKIKKEMNK